MWDLINNFGGFVALLILFAGAAISYYFLNGFVGDEASMIIGLIIAAYPAFLVFKKIG